jgi:hypothetical protein
MRVTAVDELRGVFMRVLGCVTSVLGGVAWVLVPFLSGDQATWSDYAGIGLLSLSWLILGMLTASGSLVWLRVLVGVCCVALGWALVGGFRSGVDDDTALPVAGAVAVLMGIVAFAKRPQREVRHHGSHSL